MGRQFIDTYYMQGGVAIGLLRPALMDVDSNTLNAYVQEQCVFRFMKTNPSTTAAIKLTLTAAGGETVETYISFDRSNTQYYDITEPLRCWIARNQQNFSMALTYTEFELKMTEYDANDAEIDTTGFTIRAYDAVEPLDVKFEACLPDTFRMLSDSSISGYQPACVRAIASACKVEVLLANGTVKALPPIAAEQRKNAAFDQSPSTVQLAGLR